LHYLDWGGRGETILFLPGLGSTAHAFDSIAPKLTDRFRVLALTPRAHGESGAADTLYTVETAVEDVRALMDGLSLARAHLVGHSISGSTITRFAIRYPRRAAKLVYLDATFDYGGADEAQEESKAVPRPQSEEGFPSAAEYRRWAGRYLFGLWMDALESDMWASAHAEGAEAERQARARAALLADATARPKDYRQLRAPALALWAEKTLATHYFWIDRADTAMVRRAVDHLENYRRPWERKGVERFRREAGNGRVVAFPGHHWMFIIDEKRVLMEIRGFLLGR
jgi:pimeloyl-ACP methyl ester carboxylesterase